LAAERQSLRGGRPSGAPEDTAFPSPSSWPTQSVSNADSSNVAISVYRSRSGGASRTGGRRRGRGPTNCVFVSSVVPRNTDLSLLGQALTESFARLRRRSLSRSHSRWSRNSSPALVPVVRQDRYDRREWLLRPRFRPICGMHRVRLVQPEPDVVHRAERAEGLVSVFCAEHRADTDQTLRGNCESLA
jgi:hypothetical protein